MKQPSTKKKPAKRGLRRLLRIGTRRAEGIGVAADEHLERHIFRRLSKLAQIKRFLFGWLALIVLLAVALLMQADALRDKYQSLQPVDGGTFTEGIIGQYSNANPLYATGAVDAAVSKLIFAGLFQYDQNKQLIPQLAESISIDRTETVYTVTLKPDLSWHDGQRLTSEDVVFTYELIQNPDARSYLLPSWRGIKVEAKDERTVVFTLASTLSSFPHSLTNGLVPKHLLKDVAPDQLRSSDFNTLRPIGSGPFRYETIELDGDTDNQEERQESIGLTAFDGYVLGDPKLSRFVVRTFNSSEAMEKQYSDKQITAMSSLPALPEDLKNRPGHEDLSLPLSGQVMVFFRTSEAPLNSNEVRRALTLGVDRGKVLNEVGYPLLASDSPLLSSQVGYDHKLTQPTNNIKEARGLLDTIGWRVDVKDGLRKRKGKVLGFRLYSEANSEYASVTQSLQKQWRELGVDVQVTLQSAQDLQGTVANHNYGALLYAISSGADPDIYAYWHSSQADIGARTRLNFSEYRSQIADTGLEGGRSRSDPKVRAVKYQPFLQVWLRDNPALALYHPRFLFVVREPFNGFGLDSVVSPTDRYSYVQNWTVKEAKR